MLSALISDIRVNMSPGPSIFRVFFLVGPEVTNSSFDLLGVPRWQRLGETFPQMQCLPLILKKTDPTHKAGITASHQLVFDPPHSEGQDQHSCIPYLLDQGKSVPTISV